MSLKRLALALVISLSFTGLYAAAPQASAAYQVFGNACKATGDQGAICDAQKNPTNPTSILGKVATVIAFVVGIASVIMVIIGGIVLSISNGDPSRVARGRLMIIYALVGLVVTAFAVIILRFVTNRF
jgi:hypothetical protein